MTAIARNTQHRRASTAEDARVNLTTPSPGFA